MIVKEIVSMPELLDNFDYFNDSKDTLLWLNIMIHNASNLETKQKYINLKEKLEQQTKAYWDNAFSKKN